MVSATQVYTGNRGKFSFSPQKIVDTAPWLIIMPRPENTTVIQGNYFTFIR